MIQDPYEHKNSYSRTQQAAVAVVMVTQPTAVAPPPAFTPPPVGENCVFHQPLPNMMCAPPPVWTRFAILQALRIELEMRRSELEVARRFHEERVNALARCEERLMNEERAMFLSRQPPY